MDAARAERGLPSIHGGDLPPRLDDTRPDTGACSRARSTSPTPTSCPQHHPPLSISHTTPLSPHPHSRFTPHPEHLFANQAKPLLFFAKSPHTDPPVYCFLPLHQCYGRRRPYHHARLPLLQPLPPNPPAPSHSNPASSPTRRNATPTTTPNATSPTPPTVPATAPIPAVGPRFHTLIPAGQHTGPSNGSNTGRWTTLSHVDPRRHARSSPACRSTAPLGAKPQRTERRDRPGALASCLRTLAFLHTTMRRQGFPWSIRGALSDTRCLDCVMPLYVHYDVFRCCFRIVYLGGQ